MTNKEKTNQRDFQPFTNLENCMEMMTQMMSGTGKQEEMADFCAEMEINIRSGFAGVKGSEDDLKAMMSEMMASCCGSSVPSNKIDKNTV